MTEVDQPAPPQRTIPSCPQDPASATAPRCHRIVIQRRRAPVTQAGRVGPGPRIVLRLPDPAPDQCRARVGPLALLRAAAL